MDRPIIFSGPMIRAMLEGRKTMTRRLLRGKFTGEILDFKLIGTVTKTGCPIYEMRGPGQELVYLLRGKDEMDVYYNAPYAVGDRLYVRETFGEDYTGIAEASNEGRTQTIPLARVVFKADGHEMSKAGTGWKPAIHHPRTVSRITLTVEAVKVERLQDISVKDAFAEGIPQPVHKTQGGNNIDLYPDYLKGQGHSTNHPVDSFKTLWQSLNAKRASWESNPFVVVPTFAVHKCNIDRMAA